MGKYHDQRYQSINKRQIAELLHMLEKEYRAAIEMLGIPPWNHKMKVAEVVERRRMLEQRCTILEELISDGCHPIFLFFSNSVSLGSAALLEWLTKPEPLGVNDAPRFGLEYLAYAVRRGRNKEITKCLREMESPTSLQEVRNVLDLIADHLEHKIRHKRGNEMEDIKYKRLRISRRVAAEKYCHEIQPDLHRRMYPKQKSADIKRRAREIAAKRYRIAENTLSDFMRRSRNDPRRFPYPSDEVHYDHGTRKLEGPM
jgi:hypothetical protein